MLSQLQLKITGVDKKATSVWANLVPCLFSKCYYEPMSFVKRILTQLAFVVFCRCKLNDQPGRCGVSFYGWNQECQEFQKDSLGILLTSNKETRFRIDHRT